MELCLYLERNNNPEIVIETHYKPTAIKMSAYRWQDMGLAHPINCLLFMF